jgi:hypothetical protein
MSTVTGSTPIPIGGDESAEPAFESVGLLRIPRTYPLDALPDLPDDERADVGLRTPMALVPRQHTWIRCGLPQLGDDVGVQQD